MRAYLVLGVVFAAACGGGDDQGPDAAVADAAIDGSAQCAPSADFVEADDVGNATSPEATGLITGTVGGCLEAGDVDTFAFLAADGWLSAEVTGAPGAIVVIFDSNGDPVTSSASGVLAPAMVTAGAYTLSVNDTADAGDAGYVVTIDAPVCAPASSDFTEAGDAAGRGNDMLSMTLAPSPLFQETSDTADVAEATAISASAGDTFAVSGDSEAENTDGDDFDDRDTFAWTAGADARRAIVIVDWTDPVGDPADLDAALLPAGTTEPDALGLSVENPEAFGAVLAPGAQWLWIARVHEAIAPTAVVGYTATVCVFP